ncbi:MAG TPA: helix-turn-helix domain-containing protein [Chryseosolibacter sp.]
MLLKDFLPKPENRQFVRLYRIIHFKFNGGDGEKTKAYPPRPEHVLSFFPYEPEVVQYPNKIIKNARCIITGQHDSVFHRTVKNHFLCLQIVFQPAGFFMLTGVPSSDLRNQYLEGELFFKNDIRFVNEQLYHARTYEEMLAIADRFFSKLRPAKYKSPVDKVASIILQQDGLTSIDGLADQCSLSVKQFERCFKMRTGVTPKVFSRISRFDKAFRMKNQFPDRDWLSIAMACDYYDYQHLVKDYKDFTGLTPPGFHEVDNKAPEREFGLREGYTSE